MTLLGNIGFQDIQIITSLLFLQYTLLGSEFSIANLKNSFVGFLSV